MSRNLPYIYISIGFQKLANVRELKYVNLISTEKAYHSHSPWLHTPPPETLPELRNTSPSSQPTRPERWFFREVFFAMEHFSFLSLILRIYIYLITIFHHKYMYTHIFIYIYIIISSIYKSCILYTVYMCTYYMGMSDYLGRATYMWKLETLMRGSANDHWWNAINHGDVGIFTPQGTNISYLWKRKSIFKSALGRDMLVSRCFQEGISIGPA